MSLRASGERRLFEQERSLGEFFSWYNRQRTSALAWQTPDEGYFGTLMPAVAAGGVADGVRTL